MLILDLNSLTSLPKGLKRLKHLIDLRVSSNRLKTLYLLPGIKSINNPDIHHLMSPSADYRETLHKISTHNLKTIRKYAKYKVLGLDALERQDLKATVEQTSPKMTQAKAFQTRRDFMDSHGLPMISVRVVPLGQELKEKQQKATISVVLYSNHVKDEHFLDNELDWMKLEKSRMDKMLVDPEVGALDVRVGLPESLGLDSFGELGALKKLWLRGNLIHHLCPSVRKLSSLTELDLSANCVSDFSSLLPLCSLEKLRILNLTSNRIEYIGREISGLRTLEKLLLDNNLIQSLPEMLINLKDLCELSVVYIMVAHFWRKNTVSDQFSRFNGYQQQKTP